MPSATEDGRLFAGLLVSELRERAAEEARTVAVFRSTVHLGIRAALALRYRQMLPDGVQWGSAMVMLSKRDGLEEADASPINGGAFAERLRGEWALVEEATEGMGDLRLERMEAGKLGYNRIGAGRAGVALSRCLFQQLDSAAEVQRARNVAAHELTHGEQVPLRGRLEIDGEVVDPIVLLEGHAEVCANERTGKSIEERRPGQPLELYAEGQTLVLQLRRRVGRGRIERTLTEDGDLTQLQREWDGGESPAV